MNEWVNDSDKPHSSGGKDPIIGATSGGEILLMKGDTPYRITVPGGWVVATGGEYLFAPGVSFFSGL
jgi:hypothetical protein